MPTIKNAQNRAKEKVDDAAEQVEDWQDQAQAKWDQTKRMARERAGQVQDYAENNPWQMAAIGAVAGIIIGALLMRRRD